MKNTDEIGLTPMQRIALAMVILTVQDLKAEKIFDDSKSLAIIKPYFVLTRSSKVKKSAVFSAIEYLYDDADYPLSFSSCCEALYIEPSYLKNKLLAHVKSSKESVHKYYTRWCENEKTKEKGQ